MTPSPRTLMPPSVGEYAPPHPNGQALTADTKPPFPSWLAVLVLAAMSWGIAWATVRGQMAEMRETLSRVDGRVAEMYCASLPLDKRAGCR